MDNAQTSPPSVSHLAARLLVLPAWLAPRLQSLGSRWWDNAAKADGRAFWRWLALNWQKIAAWWLTIGLGLSALLMLAALVAWQNPQVMLMRVVNFGLNVSAWSAALASRGSLVMLVLSLPVLLPAMLLTLAAMLVVSMGVVIFAPVLLIGAACFAFLFLAALFKRGGAWAARFVLGSLAESDQKASLFAKARAALGFSGANTNSQGAPKVMDGEEIERFKAANAASDRGAEILLGQINKEPFSYRTEKHVYITASSRSGKGRDLIIPNLKIQPESVFVLDPKGENCNTTAALREALGHRIAAFDPYELTDYPCAAFNPLSMLKGDDMVTGADYLAEALVVGGNDHWTQSARTLVRALSLHIATASDEAMGGYPRDLLTMREWMTGALDTTLEEMMKNGALDGMVSRLGKSLHEIPEKERGSIISTARRSTSWLDNPRLAKMFATGDACIDFDDFRDETKRLSVFVCLPATIFTTYPQVCRLLTTFSLDTMMRSLTGRRRPVMFILDELAQLDQLPIVGRAFTLGAGFGLQIWAIFQSIEQAQKLYPLDALYGSSGVRCFFKVEEPTTCEYASKASSGVLSPADIRRLPEFDMLTLLDGANPLIIERLGASLPKRQ